ncbi:MAG: OsmC family peroxiredoxin [Solirubrobacteraceae bacterium]|jgi:osmotically inducible protein OsmC
MPAKGTAEWKGDLKSGAGTFAAGDGSIKGDFSFKSRFEDGPGANPEQLIAAAHASCFSMALSAGLADAGHPVDSVKTDATVTLRFVDDAPTITKIELVTVGKVPGIDQAAFEEAAAGAKAGCPVSKALAGVPEITLKATLEA